MPSRKRLFASFPYCPSSVQQAESHYSTMCAPGLTNVFLFVFVVLCSISFQNAEHIQRKRAASNAECGLSVDPDKFSTLIKGGSSTRQGEFPWVAAIYLKSKGEDKWAQGCAGALLSPQIVLTVAHCLVHHPSGKIKAEDVKVGLGKYQRDYYTFENDSIIADVAEVVTPRLYNGAVSGFALDIGLVVLKERVRLTPFIRPVCLDWTSVTPKTGDVGHFAGWGITDDGTSSKSLLSAKLTYVSNADCLKGLRPDFYKFVTADKFCVGSVNGTDVQKGDTGGPMTLIEGERHHLIGVLSTRLSRGENHTTMFTDVLNPEHKQWLQNEMERLEKTNEKN